MSVNAERKAREAVLIEKREIQNRLEREYQTANQELNRAEQNFDIVIDMYGEIIDQRDTLESHRDAINAELREKRKEIRSLEKKRVDSLSALKYLEEKALSFGHLPQILSAEFRGE